MFNYQLNTSPPQDGFLLFRLKIMDDDANKEITEETSATAEPLASPKDPRTPVGVTMANARKAMDKTVEQVARELNLSASTIRSLENGQSDSLPELTYVRGYVRSYARLLNLDPEEMLEAFAKGHHNTKEVRYDELPHGMSDDDFLAARKRRSPWLWMVIIAALLMTAWIWKPAFLDDLFESSPPVLSSSPQERQSQRDALEDSVVSEITPEIQAEPRSLPQDVPQTLPQESESAEPAVLDDVAQQNTLILSFTSTCWVDVRDSQGTRLAFQSVVGGEQLELSSALAMEVFLGNADGVTATLNGVPFDLSPHIQGVYAKFSIAAPTAQ